MNPEVPKMSLEGLFNAVESHENISFEYFKELVESNSSDLSDEAKIYAARFLIYSAVTKLQDLSAEDMAKYLKLALQYSAPSLGSGIAKKYKKAAELNKGFLELKYKQIDTTSNSEIKTIHLLGFGDKYQQRIQTLEDIAINAKTCQQLNATEGVKTKPSNGSITSFVIFSKNSESKEEENEIKLHINLNPNDYHKDQITLIEILSKAISNDVITSFKVTPVSSAQAQNEIADIQIKALENILPLFEEPLQNNTETTEKLKDRIGIHNFSILKNLCGSLTKKDIEDKLNFLRKDKESYARLEQSAQVTIYLPAELNYEAIVNLANEIENKLQNYEASTPYTTFYKGEKYSPESIVSPHISLRQDKYKTDNISYVAWNATEYEKYSKLKSLQEESTLYSKLKNNFDHKKDFSADEDADFYMVPYVWGSAAFLLALITMMLIAATAYIAAVQPDIVINEVPIDWLTATFIAITAALAGILSTFITGFMAFISAGDSPSSTHDYNHENKSEHEFNNNSSKDKENDLVKKVTECDYPSAVHSNTNGTENRTDTSTEPTLTSAHTPNNIK